MKLSPELYSINRPIRPLYEPALAFTLDDAVLGHHTYAVEHLARNGGDAVDQQFAAGRPASSQPHRRYVDERYQIPGGGRAVE